MKILQVINNLGSGGAEKLVAEISPLMKRAGHDVEVLLLRKHGSIYIEALQKNKIEVNWLSSEKLWSILSLISLIKYIRKREFDIIHAHIFPTFYYIALASLFTQNKNCFFYTEHNTTNKRRGKPIFQFIEKKLYKRFTRILAISNAVAENLKIHLQDTKTEITVIENGIDIKRFSEATATNVIEEYVSVKNGDFPIVMIGRFSPSKQQETIVYALQRLDDKFKLILVGEGERKKEIEDLVKRLNLTDRVFFLGVRTDVSEIIASSKVGVLSSNWEGFGLVAVEIMAVGRPIIASDVEGLNDIVRGAGLLFPAGDSEKLTNQIKLLSEDKELYERTSANCYERAQRYDINTMVKGYLKEYMHT